MKVVIDISEEDYGLTCWMKHPEVIFGAYAQAIKNCIPLPKGHGRLIDGDYLYKKFKANGIENIEQGYLALEMIKDEPTILEADKG